MASVATISGPRRIDRAVAAMVDLGEPGVRHGPAAVPILDHERQRRAGRFTELAGEGINAVAAPWDEVSDSEGYGKPQSGYDEALAALRRVAAVVSGSG